MTKTMAEHLTAALRDEQLIRLYRPFEDTYVRGYILDVGAEFFLLSLVSDRIWFDGFECFRIDEVDEVAADPYARFTETALAARDQSRPELALRLASIGELLTSVAEQFPLAGNQRRRRHRLDAGDRPPRPMGSRSVGPQDQRDHPRQFRRRL
jgi:hypothetical protein